MGLAAAPTEALRGGEVEENVQILRSVLQGKGSQAQQDVVALNAALALYVGGAAVGDTLLEAAAKGVALARNILKSGAAWGKGWNSWRTFLRE